MNLDLLAYIALGIGIIPALVALSNASRFRPPAPTGDGWRQRPVSILIPARNEAANIGRCVRRALENLGEADEVIVLDDSSEDDTAAIVLDLAREDSRVRLVRSEPLPEGWVGKIHACWQLANAARGELFLFIDADVRLEPDCARRMAQFLEAKNAGMVSGFPRQLTGTMTERLLIPLIHFVLLGFLSIKRMRRSIKPAYGTACGQVMLAERDAYFSSGGHEVVRDSIHDGLDIPRAFRRAGQHTDLCDITALCSCRMYHNGRDTIQGLAKNASRGLGSAALILPATIFLFGGQVLPFILLAGAPFGWLGVGGMVAATTAALLALAQRLSQAETFRLTPLGALLHPVGISLLLSIQWMAFARKRLGIQPVWKGRAIPT